MFKYKSKDYTFYYTILDKEDLVIYTKLWKGDTIEDIMLLKNIFKSFDIPIIFDIIKTIISLKNINDDDMYCFKNNSCGICGVQPKLNTFTHMSNNFLFCCQSCFDGMILKFYFNKAFKVKDMPHIKYKRLVRYTPLET